MNLKVATLIALIGQLVRVIPTIVAQIFTIGEGFYKVFKYISLGCYLIGAVTMIFFFFVLFKKQR